MELIEVLPTQTKQLRQLLEYESDHALSLVFPTQQKGSDTQQNSIRFKNLWRSAKERLNTVCPHEHALHDALGVLQTLETDQDFWNHQMGGVGFYVGEETTQFVRFPSPPLHTLMCNTYWYLRPIFPLLNPSQPFWLLAIEESAVRLWQGNEFNLIPWPLPKDTPTTIEATWPTTRKKRAVQFHTGTPGSPRGKRAAQYHGGLDTNKDDASLTTYCQQIHHSLQPLWTQTPWPIVVVADESIFSFYADAETPPHVHVGHIAQHPQSQSSDDLHAAALSLLPPPRLSDPEQLQELVALARQEHRFATELSSILLDAFHGRVDTLWIAQEQQQWGTFLPEQQTIIEHSTHHPGQTELINLAGILTLRNSGAVLTVPQQELPVVETNVGVPKVANALLRY